MSVGGLCVDSVICEPAQVGAAWCVAPVVPCRTLLIHMFQGMKRRGYWPDMAGAVPLPVGALETDDASWLPVGLRAWLSSLIWICCARLFDMGMLCPPCCVERREAQAAVAC